MSLPNELSPNSSLRTLRAALQKLSYSKPYFVPGIWQPDASSPDAVSVNAPEYYGKTIDSILAQPASPMAASVGGDWSKRAVIYNMFPRLTTAFDHNRNGAIDIDISKNEFRETGTFLKCIALLPYIKQLGATTVHLLPITSIGHDGNKGSLGSPYAIKNPYKLDENLSEPILNLDVETEFKAFVDAAHHLGLRVVVEFVFRTSAKDGDWVKEHPEWFYWIDDRLENRPAGATDAMRYGNPVFTNDELAVINSKVNRGDLSALPPPSALYRSFFTKTPEKVLYENGRYVGKTSDNRTCRIPGAFADWPPDDTQPPWGDVTYLKMYDHPDFNYIAYNTIRMYSAELAQPRYANKALWEKIIGIIPHYQTTFGIDGVMIDMGHALPVDLKKQMVRTARETNPDFAFWDENFDITRKSIDEGYNAVIGGLGFVGHQFSDLKKFLSYYGENGVPIPFFATTESHNTPRNASRFGGGEAGENYAKFMFGVCCFLPAIAFVHSGMELGEWYPVNTGIGFSSGDLEMFPSEKLPLFSEGGYDWTNTKSAAMYRYMQTMIALRTRFLDVITDASPRSMTILDIEGSAALVMLRKAHGKELLFMANAHPVQPQLVELPMRVSKQSLTDLVSGASFEVSDTVFSLMLAPGECAVFEI
jgi:starch synthase (maltosyl-transferring)